MVILAARDSVAAEACAHDDGQEAEFIASGLGDRIGRYFDRVEPRQQAVRYATALLAKAQRKNGWRIAQEIGDASPWRTQRLLHRASWDVDGVRDALRDYATEHLGHPEAVIALGELATIKRGTASVGVSAQYSATTERVENCQLAVFAAYASRHGAALVDRELFLPGAWAADDARCRRAGVPHNARRAKGELGREMVRRARAAGVPFSWVTGDADFGRETSLLRWLTESGCGYVLGIPASTVVAGQGAGVTAVEALGAPLLADRTVQTETDPSGRSLWACAPVRLLAPRGQADVRPATGCEHILVVERPRGERRCVYHLAHAPQATSLAQLVTVIKARQHTAVCLRDAQDRAGLDQYEVRTWKAWYRHVTLAMLAVAPGRVERAAAGHEVPGQRDPLPIEA